MEKRLKQLASTCIIQNELVMTPGILLHKGQSCPTSSKVLDYDAIHILKKSYQSYTAYLAYGR